MNKTPAEPVRELLQSKVIGTGKGGFTLTLYREDFSALYPGMVRFVLEVMSEGRTLDVFRTNTYEYSPLVPLAAENVALRKADEWARELPPARTRFFPATTEPCRSVQGPRPATWSLSRGARGRTGTVAFSLPGLWKQRKQPAGPPG